MTYILDSVRSIKKVFNSLNIINDVGTENNDFETA